MFPSDIKIRSVNGSSIDVQGVTYVPTRFGNKTFTIKYVVSDSIPYDCILGIDFLRATGTHLMMDEMTARIGKVKVPLRITLKPPRTCNISVVSKCVVKANSLQVVTAEVNQKLAGNAQTPGLCTPISSRQDALKMELALAIPIDSKVQLYMLNNSDKDVEIAEGANIGTFQPLPTKGSTIVAATSAILPGNQIDFNQLKCNDLSSHQQLRLRKLINEYADLFSHKLGRTKVIRHAIDTQNCRPVHTAPRRTNPIARQQIANELENLLEQDVIEPSVSPWASPIVLIKKKSGDWRVCVDYRKLNSKTVRDVYPLPRIDETLDAL